MVLLLIEYAGAVLSGGGGGRSGGAATGSSSRLGGGIAPLGSHLNKLAEKASGSICVLKMKLTRDITKYTL